MSKSKKHQNLKKQLILQASSPSIDSSEQLGNIDSADRDSENSKYYVEKHPYIIQDLKKTGWIAGIALLFLLAIYFLNNTEFIKNLSNDIYNFLHLT